MRVALHTDTPCFFADIADVLRIFWGQASVTASGAGADATLTHSHSKVYGEWVDTFTWKMNDHCVSHTGRKPVQSGALVGKRMQKRAVKTCCYTLIKQVTGLWPPWGSLTGIRPTRLYYEQLAMGATPEQAEAALVSLFDLAPQKAALLGEAVRSQHGMLDFQDDALDVYLGIPFCPTRCDYCSFPSGAIGKGNTVAPYLEALNREIEAMGALLRDCGLRVRAIYVGGGTPTSLTASQLSNLLTRMERAFPGAVEWTVEAGRPDSLDSEKLAMLRCHPVTRISINPQTMHDVTLARIGRGHTAEQVAWAFGLARDAGFRNINMDVICALPGETESDFAGTLKATARLGPESLTVHTLALKRAAKLWNATYSQCDADAAARMVDMGREAAAAMGMCAYCLYRQKYMAGNLENVGYSKPGYVCRYNIDLMEETTSVMALGAGGISKRVFGEETRIERAPNVSNLDHYIARVDEMIGRKRDLWQKTTGARSLERGTAYDTRQDDSYR